MWKPLLGTVLSETGKKITRIIITCCHLEFGHNLWPREKHSYYPQSPRRSLWSIILALLFETVVRCRQNSIANLGCQKFASLNHWWGCAILMWRGSKLWFCQDSQLNLIHLDLPTLDGGFTPETVLLQQTSKQTNKQKTQIQQPPNCLPLC